MFCKRENNVGQSPHRNYGLLNIRNEKCVRLRGDAWV